MQNQFSRIGMLLGSPAMEKLNNSRVAVFGVGGVGGFIAEALVRSGVGSIDIIDGDTVSVTNLNRQIPALSSTIGLYKADVMKARLKDINPDAKVHVYKKFLLRDNTDEFPFEEYDYIADAVDMVTAKILLASIAAERGIPIISAMGTGNKTDPGRLRIADIYDTKVCPLARVMRRELRARGIGRLKVVYSDEPPLSPGSGAAQDLERGSCTAGEVDRGSGAYKTVREGCTAGETNSGICGAENTDPANCKLTECDEITGDGSGPSRRGLPGSTVFVPGTAGLMMAAEIVRELTENV